MRVDPQEWTNLAGDAKHAATKTTLAAFLPQTNAAPLGNGKIRLLEQIDGVWYWAGEPIEPGSPVPQ